MSLEQIFGSWHRGTDFDIFLCHSLYQRATNKLDLNAKNCRKSGEEQRRPCGWTSCCHLKQICRLDKRK